MTTPVVVGRVVGMISRVPCPLDVRVVMLPLIALDVGARTRSPVPDSDMRRGEEDEYEYEEERSPLAACLLWPCLSAVRAPILCCCVAGPLFPCFWIGGKLIDA